MKELTPKKILTIVFIVAVLVSATLLPSSAYSSTDEVLPPREVQAHAGDDGNLLVRLDWLPSETPGVEAYRIYRSDGGRSRKVSADTTSYVDYDVSKGEDYYYVITTVKGNLESLGDYTGYIEVTEGNHPPYFYPPIRKWELVEHDCVLEIKGSDPDGDTELSSWVEEFSPELWGYEFRYDGVTDAGAFTWQTSSTGIFEITFRIEDDHGLSSEETARIAIANPNELIYIDGNPFWLKDRIPDEGILSEVDPYLYTGHADYAYQERCTVCDLEGTFYHEVEFLDGYLRKINPSFIPSRDLRSRLQNLAIPITTPGIFNLAIVKGNELDSQH